MKENRADFQRLGSTCASIIAAVWESYLRSPNKEHWPPHELSSVIRDLVECVSGSLSHCRSVPHLFLDCRTLDKIQDFLEDKIKRPKAIRFIHNVTDRGKVVEYRQRLEDAIKKFEVRNEAWLLSILIPANTGHFQGFIPSQH